MLMRAGATASFSGLCGYCIGSAAGSLLYHYSCEHGFLSAPLLVSVDVGTTLRDNGGHRLRWPLDTAQICCIPSFCMLPCSVFSALALHKPSTQSRWMTELEEESV